MPSDAGSLLRDAERVLVLGIGGGGDVVGALAAAELCRERGTAAVVGGLTWERQPVDPSPGPRPLDECHGVERLHEAAALARPDAGGGGGTAHPFRFAEGRVAELLGVPTVLIDPNPAPRTIAAGIDAAAEHLGCDLVVLLDVGGDALAHGDEPGLASPLADAVLLAASTHLRTPAIGAVFGAGCDGELTPEEVAARVAEVREAGGDLGALAPKDLATLERAVRTVPTEASAMALRCARGERGVASIRDGRREVPLTPAGGVVQFVDLPATLGSAARLAALLVDAASLTDADATLRAAGVRTELAYEEDRERTVVDARMRSYYDRRAREYDDWWHGTGRFAARDRPGWADEVARLRDVLGALDPVPTLDVACGSGFLTAALPGAITAIDQSPAVVEVAAERLPDADVRVGDAVPLPFADGAFGRVHAGHFYGHLLEDERGRFVAEARRVGGELVITDSALRPGEPAGAWQERVLDDGSRHRVYKRWFTPDGLRDELGGEGEVLLAGTWFVVVKLTV